MDLNGTLFEVSSLDANSASLVQFRKEMKATGNLVEDWTFMRLVIGVPDGPWRFNYSPDHNATIVIDKSGARYENVWIRGPLDKLPMNLRSILGPQQVSQGQLYEGLLMFRPSLKASEVSQVWMMIGGHLQQLYKTP